MNTTTTHEPGASCPACPTITEWTNHHCYGCGGVFTTPADECVGQENPEHADCFE